MTILDIVLRLIVILLLINKTISIILPLKNAGLPLPISKDKVILNNKINNIIIPSILTNSIINNIIIYTIDKRRYIYNQLYQYKGTIIIFIQFIYLLSLIIQFIYYYH
jgi:hypothetical protein